VLAHHRAVLNELHQGLGKEVVLVTGETPEANRAAAIERFQTEPMTRFFLGSIRAMGIGVTLTAASRVIFVEQDWTPAILRQAEDRLHRIGTLDNVLVQHLVLAGSLDAVMARTLIAKQAVVSQVLELQP